MHLKSYIYRFGDGLWKRTTNENTKKKICHRWCMNMWNTSQITMETVFNMLIPIECMVWRQTPSMQRKILKINAICLECNKNDEILLWRNYTLYIQHCTQSHFTSDERKQKYCIFKQFRSKSNHTHWFHVKMTVNSIWPHLNGPTEIMAIDWKFDLNLFT